MTLTQHLGILYRADVLAQGNFSVVLTNFRDALTNDIDLHNEAAQRLAELQAVLQAKPRDYITDKQVNYLTKALT